jgi:hypothetical protein
LEILNMFSCKVLVGPIATDKEYHTGDTVCLDKKDADTLSGFGLVEIIGEVQPKFVAQVLPPAEVAGAALTIDLFPVADEIAPAVETPAVVTEIAPVIETPVVVATVGDSLPLGTVAAPEIVTPEPVVETPVAGEAAPVIETAIVDEATIIVGVGDSLPLGTASAPADGEEEAIGLEEVASSTGSKRKK